jgi:hypothetical protein
MITYDKGKGAWRWWVYCIAAAYYWEPLDALGRVLRTYSQDGSRGGNSRSSPHTMMNLFVSFSIWPELTQRSLDHTTG